MRRVLLFAFLIVMLAGTAAAQELPHRAGLVVQFSDGQVETACVRFSEAEITGLDLLERSEIPVVAQTSPIGAAVCKIGPDGCDYPAESCFCAREGARAVYWAYHLLDGGQWRYSSLGAANTMVRDGDVNGWAWGLGDSATGAQPPPLSIDAICGPVEPTVAPASPDTVTQAASTAAPPVAAPTAPPSTSSGVPPSTSSGGTGDGSLLNYLGFGVLALGLIVGVIVSLRRRHL